MDADVVGIMPKTDSVKSAQESKDFMFKANTVTPHLQALLIDTGASSHIIRDKDKFQRQL